jgi:hypothetical protein
VAPAGSERNAAWCAQALVNRVSNKTATSFLSIGNLFSRTAFRQTCLDFVQTACRSRSVHPRAARLAAVAAGRQTQTSVIIKSTGSSLEFDAAAAASGDRGQDTAPARDFTDWHVQ